MAIIAVSGHPGAGKTVLCNRLVDFLKYKSHYTGELFKKMAQDNGISEDELYKRMAKHPSYEIMIDAAQSRLMRTEDNYIIQGRIAPFQEANPAFKKINILLTVSDEEGARRQLSRQTNENKALEQMLIESRSRVEEEKIHYRDLYGIKNHFDPKYFQIVLDTTFLNEEEVFCEIIKMLTPLLECSPAQASGQ